MRHPSEHDPDSRSVIDPRNHEVSAAIVRDLGLSDADVDEIIDLFEALRRWRRTSDAQRDASRHHMRLGENDMRAIRYLMSAGRRGSTITSTMLAEHLGLQGSSVTKLLDRLERAGHIRREPHPSDRRALSIVVTDSTRATASSSVGADHLRRFMVAAAMPSEERQVVSRFLTALADLPVVDHAEDAAGE
ncbi:MarR family transcriptional regulator [Agrococcus sp. ARC_14]|uniref:MarR family winged helix-turn-helix transcriptional regulator n=1 Tax=Agrococcus sp. ARC_14 TaxID=2919927 RepID=UPI002407C3B4|nr:MarR family transcriptional regulator [Agrococcus sp. ARC_14]